MKAQTHIPSDRFQTNPVACRRITVPDSRPVARQWSARPGFTLVELLAVLVVILLLTGMIIGLANQAQRATSVTRTKAEIARMCLALESYKTDFGSYPTLNNNSVHYPTSTQASNTPPAALVSNNFFLVHALVGQGKTYIKFQARQLSTEWVAICGDPGMASWTNVLDPFGTPYNYFCTSLRTNQVNQGSFDLMSYGPDTSPHNTDDINNFQR